MRIKEMEDVLVLVDELPAERQELCAMVLAGIVRDWEAQTAEGVDGREWRRISRERWAEQRKR